MNKLRGRGSQSHISPDHLRLKEVTTRYLVRARPNRRLPRAATKAPRRKRPCRPRPPAIGPKIHHGHGMMCVEHRGPEQPNLLSRSASCPLKKKYNVIDEIVDVEWLFEDLRASPMRRQ